MVLTPNPRRPFAVEKKGDLRSVKPRPWSHQDDLRKAGGKEIQINLIGYVNTIRGVLLNADQFTLKVRLVDGGKSPMTYFKHSIESYAFEE